MIKYFNAPDIQEQIQDIVDVLNIEHDVGRIKCIKSTGSKSRYTLARCHTVSRAVQTGLNIEAHYIIEVITENYNKLSEEEQMKTLIHEIMHIPKAFGGGFKGHKLVNKKSVDKMYDQYKNSLIV